MLSLLFIFDFRVASAVELNCSHKDETNRYVSREFEIQGDSNTMRIYYRLLRPFNPQLPTLFYLPGGPGGDSTHLDQIQKTELLVENFNLVSYDQRGTHCTKEVGPINWRYTPGYYSMRQSIQDMEAVRHDLLEDAPIFIYGVSYGSMLAQEYAFAYSDRVSALVLDATGYGAESTRYAREHFLDKFISGVPETSELYRQVTGKYAEARSHILRFAFDLAYGPNFSRSFQAHLRRILEAATPQVAEKIYSRKSHKPYFGMTLQIMCEEFWDYPDNATWPFLNPLDSQCLSFKPHRTPMDSRDKLRNLQTRTLILAGYWDPITPIESAMAMRDLLPNAAIYKDMDGAHGVLVHRKTCAVALMKMLFDGVSVGAIEASVPSMESCTATATSDSLTEPAERAWPM